MCVFKKLFFSLVVTSGRTGLRDWCEDIYDCRTSDIVWYIHELGAGVDILERKDDGSGVSHSYYYMLLNWKGGHKVELCDRLSSG